MHQNAFTGRPTSSLEPPVTRRAVVTDRAQSGPIREASALPGHSALQGGAWHHVVEGNWPHRSGANRTRDLLDLDTAARDDDEDPHDGVRVAELSFAEKYADAFWRLVPIPALVVADGVALARHPSAPGVAALALLALVGSFVEVVIWNGLRLRWQRGLHPESVGRLYEPNHRLELVLLVILWLAAFTWKASGVAERFSDVLITVLIGVLVFGGAVAVDIVRRGRS